MLKIFRYLLWPLSLLYGFIVFWRNKLYDWGIFKSDSFEKPVICVGNLAVGGSGKTPATEYLVNLLAGYRIAILSRGYGRKTKGFIFAGPGSTASQIGDEPLQYHHKFPHVTVAVCEDRVYGVQQLISNHDVILLDDAFQHRRIRAGFNLLLFEFEKILKPQFLLPVGNLREPLSGRKRADAVLITKSPFPVNRYDQISIHKKLDMPGGQRISFASLDYAEPQHIYTSAPMEDWRDKVVFLLTGIANPGPLIRYVESQAGQELVSFEFPDHYRFVRADVKKLIAAFEGHPAKEKIIITTEKDSKRLLDENLKDLLLNLPIGYIPVKMAVSLKDKDIFDQKILDYVAGTKRIS